MATAEAETSQDERGAPGGVVYDGFISYSHAADDLLAPRLQAGLQRFAKPWWKRRALRIFRDESSLSANPHLWSSITDALDRSGWFVLLLSPEAAESPWVNNEVEYWLEHKDPDRIIPVLTDGEFSWHDGDVTGDAFPAALAGAFSDEPRWVDLRFARTEEQLDLKNPTFSAAIADIASPIRGIPKDELESEEVRQHRRTVRTAWGAGALVLALAIAAGATAFFAVGQRNQARTQTEVAQTERDRAVEAEDAASAATESEAEQRAEAEQQARFAKSRELVAASVSVLDDDPELSMMLALESLNTEEASPTAVETLREAMLESHLLRRFEGGTYGRISPDGSTIYLADAESTLTTIGIDSDEPLWLYEVPSGEVGRVAISPDGRLVAVQVHPPTEGESEFQVVILDTSSGAVVVTLEPGDGCHGVDAEGVSYEGDFSSDGKWFSIFTGTAFCGRAPNEGWVVVYDTATWEEAHRLQTEDGAVRSADISEDSGLVVLSGQGGVAELRSFPDLLLINRFDRITGAALSPDGSRVVLGDANFDFRPLLADSLTGTPINYLDPIEFFTSFEPFSFSADGTALAVTTRGHDFVFDGDGGRLLAKLGEQGPTLSQSLSADGSLLLTTNGEEAQLWNLATGSSIDAGSIDPFWINPNEATSGPHVAVNVAAWTADGGFTYAVTLLDPASGSTTQHLLGLGTQLPDGRFIASLTQPDGDDYLMGPLVVWDPATNTTVSLTDCVASAEDLLNGVEIECSGGEPFFGEDGAINKPVVASADGSVFAAGSTIVVDPNEPDPVRIVQIWDAQSFEPISEFTIPAAEWLTAITETWVATQDDFESLVIYDLGGQVVARIEPEDLPLNRHVEFDASRSLIYVTDVAGLVFAYDTTTWELIHQWDAHDSVIRGIALSPDGTTLVTTGEDDFVRTWDVAGIRETGATALQQIPAPKPSDAVWLSEDSLGIYLADGARWLRMNLEQPDLVAEAKARLTRGFTERECMVYAIDNCPMTLEDIKSGG